jgi:zinc/manganese transport system ATP-binding protein
VLTDANLQHARTMAEAWDETAAICDIDGTLNGQDFDTLLEQNLAQSLAATPAAQPAARRT